MLFQTFFNCFLYVLDQKSSMLIKTGSDVKRFMVPRQFKTWFYLLVTAKSFFLCIDTQVPFASQIRFEKLLLYIYPKVLKKQEEKSNRLR